MLRKRIIFTLIYDNGFFNQSRNFRLQKVGNINWLEKNYKFQDIAFSLDELIVLDASKNEKKISEFAATLTKLVDDVFIPVAAGGGIRSLADAAILFAHGADKIILNTSIYENKTLVKNLVGKYGSQSVVAAVDHIGQDVYINDGTKKLDISLDQYIKYIEQLSVGEVYLNSIEKDGTGFGYDIDTIEQVSKLLSMPLIIAGGAGNEKHLIEGLKLDGVNAAATANLFNFMGNGLPNARIKALQSNCNLANWHTVESSITKEQR